MNAVITNKNERVKVKAGRIIVDLDKKIINIQLSQNKPISYIINDLQLEQFIAFLILMEENNPNIKFCDFNVSKDLSKIKKPNKIIADIKTLNKRWIFLFLILGGDAVIDLVNYIVSLF